MKYLQKFNESENRTLKQVLDEAMFEIKDNFDVTIFDEGRSVRDFEHGVVVLSIIFEYMNSRGEFSFKDDNSFMGENYPGIDTGIEYADTYAAFMKGIRK